jgi:hypothetical protein
MIDENKCLQDECRTNKEPFSTEDEVIFPFISGIRTNLARSTAIGNF